MAILATPTLEEISKEQFIEKGLLIEGKKRYKERWLAEFYETANQSIGLPVLANCKSRDARDALWPSMAKVLLALRDCPLGRGRPRPRAAT